MVGGWLALSRQAVVQARVSRLEIQQAKLIRICSHCGGGGGHPGVPLEIEDTHIVCQSLECGVYFERIKTRNELKNMHALTSAALELLML
jgi:hypothetical protein